MRLFILEVFDFGAAMAEGRDLGLRIRESGFLFLFGLLCTLWFPRPRAWLRFTENEVRVFSQGRGQVDTASLLGDDA